jgi:lysine biosynthesis protein LysW
MLKFNCPECGAGLSVEDVQAGSATDCPECGARLRVPFGPAVPRRKAPEPPPAKPAAAERPIAAARPPRRYPALRYLAYCNLGMGALVWLAMLCWPLLWFFTASLYHSLRGWEVAGQTFGLFTLGVFYFASGESIMIFVDIEQNTREQALWMRALVVNVESRKQLSAKSE